MIENSDQATEMTSRYGRLRNHQRSYPSPLRKLNKFQKTQIIELRKFARTTPGFLKEVDWERKIATNQVESTLKWRGSFNPRGMNLHQMIRYITKHNLEDLRAIFPYGHDKSGRPIVYMNLSEITRIPVDEEGVDFTFRMIVLVMEDVLINMPKGHVDFTLVLDVSGVGLSFGSIIRKVGHKFAKFGEYYSGILHKAYTVNAGWVVRGLWKIASLFMDKETVEKFTIRKNPRILRDIIDERHIPSFFGGKRCKLEFRLFDYLELLIVERKERLVEQKRDHLMKKQLAKTGKRGVTSSNRNRRTDQPSSSGSSDPLIPQNTSSVIPPPRSFSPVWKSLPTSIDNEEDVVVQPPRRIYSNMSSTSSGSDNMSQFQPHDFLEEPSTPTIWDIEDFSDDEEGEDEADLIDNLLDRIVKEDEAFKQEKIDNDLYQQSQQQRQYSSPRKRKNQKKNGPEKILQSPTAQGNVYMKKKSSDELDFLDAAPIFQDDDTDHHDELYEDFYETYTEEVRRRANSDKGVKVLAPRSLQHFYQVKNQRESKFPHNSNIGKMMINTNNTNSNNGTARRRLNGAQTMIVQSVTKKPTVMMKKKRRRRPKGLANLKIRKLKQGGKITMHTGGSMTPVYVAGEMKRKKIFSTSAPSPGTFDEYKIQNIHDDEPDDPIPILEENVVDKVPMTAQPSSKTKGWFNGLFG